MERKRNTSRGTRSKDRAEEVKDERSKKRTPAMKALENEDTAGALNMSIKKSLQGRLVKLRR